MLLQCHDYDARPEPAVLDIMQDIKGPEAGDRRADSSQLNSHAVSIVKTEATMHHVSSSPITSHSGLCLLQQTLGLSGSKESWFKAQAQLFSFQHRFFPRTTSIKMECVLKTVAVLLFTKLLHLTLRIHFFLCVHTLGI